MIKATKAQAYADKVAEVLKPYCHRIEVVGPLLRGVEEVEFISLLLTPHDPKLTDIIKRCEVGGIVTDRGPLGFSFSINRKATEASPKPNPIKCKIYKARHPTHAAPSNFAAMKLITSYDTSKLREVYTVATAKGYRFDTMEGLFIGNEAVKTDTPEEILERLGLEVSYIGPNQSPLL